MSELVLHPCKYCGQKFFWAEDGSTGKWIAIDAAVQAYLVTKASGTSPVAHQTHGASVAHKDVCPEEQRRRAAPPGLTPTPPSRPERKDIDG